VLHSLEPDLRHVLLIKAALLDERDARAAWLAWLPDGDVDTLDPDSQWLLPQLYCNLRRAGVEPVLLARYANVYRHNWYKNQLLLRAAQPLLSALSQAGCRPLLLGAAAVLAAYYSEPGARPIDALVLAVADLPTAAALAAELGWPVPTGPAANSHRVTASDSYGRRLILRRHILGADADGRMRARARSVSTASEAPPELAAPDQLLHIFAERETWDARSRLLWVADAGRILASLDAPEWECVLVEADQLGLRPIVSDACCLLRDGFGLGVLHAMPGV
jgi:hypothetical protein